MLTVKQIKIANGMGDSEMKILSHEKVAGAREKSFAYKKTNFNDL